MQKTKLARRLHQNNENQRKERWRDAWFLPPRFPCHPDPLRPRLRSAWRPACTRGACTPSPPARSPNFILARTQICLSASSRFPQSLIHEETVQIPLVPSYSLRNPSPIHHPRGRNRTQVVPKNEAEVKSGRRWSSKSRRCSNHRCFFPRWSSSLPSSDRP